MISRQYWHKQGGLVDGAKVKVLREQAGLSRSQAGSYMIGREVNHELAGHWWEIEGEKVFPCWQTIKAMARVLKCAPDDFLRYPIAYGRGQKPKTTPRYSKSIGVFARQALERNFSVSIREQPGVKAGGDG